MVTAARKQKNCSCDYMQTKQIYPINQSLQMDITCNSDADRDKVRYSDFQDFNLHKNLIFFFRKNAIYLDLD
jgi:hypothetical protein